MRIYSYNQSKRVSSHAKLPGKWKSILRNDDNKDELLKFLEH